MFIRMLHSNNSIFLKYMYKNDVVLKNYEN